MTSVLVKTEKIFESPIDKVYMNIILQYHFSFRKMNRIGLVLAALAVVAAARATTSETRYTIQILDLPLPNVQAAKIKMNSIRFGFPIG